MGVCVPESFCKMEYLNKRMPLTRAYYMPFSNPQVENNCKLILNSLDLIQVTLEDNQDKLRNGWSWQ